MELNIFELLYPGPFDLQDTRLQLPSVAVPQVLRDSPCFARYSPWCCKVPPGFPKPVLPSKDGEALPERI
jgi:hypothetical protein